jgi:hypothetical protein
MQDREYRPAEDPPETAGSVPRDESDQPAPEPREDPMLETQAAEEMRTRSPEPVRDAPAGPALGDYQQRFESLQSEFIEEPRAAVEKAESLVEEAVDRMMTTLRDRIQRVHSEIGEGSDTERLRLAMRSYRDLIDSMPTD